MNMAMENTKKEFTKTKWIFAEMFIRFVFYTIILLKKTLLIYFQYFLYLQLFH